MLPPFPGPPYVQVHGAKQPGRKKKKRNKIKKKKRRKRKGTQGRSFLSHILLLDGNIVASGDQNMPGTAGNTNSCGRSSPNLLATSFDTTPKTFGESFTMFNKFAILIVDGLLESASIDCNPGARLGAAPSFLISFFVIE